MRDLSELLEELRSEPAYPECCEQAADEIERLRHRAYDLAVAIMGGEDAPGYADSIETEELVELARQNRIYSGAREDALIAEVERLTRQLAEAREALLALVLCPCISERDMEPAWRCTETDEAERRARAVLARIDAGEREVVL